MQAADDVATMQLCFAQEDFMTAAAAPPSPKEAITSLIQEQPDDATVEELLREIAYAAMIQRGLADLDAGRTISDSDFQQRIKSWSK